ncbi:MFS transporter [Gordonia jinghuaiqii]|uniref:MFS transporter n=1 Tax=Gordonia jinghuaiqii TaxID=2758710 RepID=A0A7D7LW76_9ACTN|nr:MFS transporter [Gordonia jinghuaiqii]MCR5978370.1 MFS transporter [Gordonia jinghuaiqii]QMT01198.1 MFS transporter [Gordonia jinghuaiqii]
MTIAHPPTETVDDPSVARGVAPRSSFQLIFDRRFGLVFWGKAFINFGMWAQSIVIVILTYQLTGSATWAGLVTAAQLSPQLVLSPISGRLSNTYGPVSQILAGGVLLGTSSVGLGVYLLMVDIDAADGRALPLVLAALVSGIGLAMVAPSLQAIVPKLVTRAELPNAVSLNFIPTALARSGGPALGAVLVATVGPEVGLLVLGVGQILCSVLFLTVHVGSEKIRPGGDRTISGALKHIWRDKVLFAMLAGVAAIGMASEPAVTLAPAMATSLGRDAGSGGFVAAAFGVGGFLGVIAHRLLIRVMSAATEGCTVLVVIGVAIGSAGLVSSMPVLMGLLVLAGACMVAGITAFSIAVQERCPADMVGRVMALWVIAFAGSRPFAGLAQGAVAEHLSLVAALVATALITFVAAAWVLATVRRGRRHAMTPPCATS